jgi:hypothetical protein
MRLRELKMNKIEPVPTFIDEIYVIKIDHFLHLEIFA